MKNIKPHYIVSVLFLGGIVFSAVGFNHNQLPLFENLEQFVLFAQEEIKLEKGAQISSGDLGSNSSINIQKDAVISGNLFADRIDIDKNTTVNGNASYNKLKIDKSSQILGTKTKPVHLPIANLPSIPEFTVGKQDFKFTGQENTLNSGAYRNITLEKDSKLTLTGGTYNINKLELKENSTLVFDSPAIMNIQFKLKGQNRIAILPGPNLKSDDLIINYNGFLKKEDTRRFPWLPFGGTITSKEEPEDDDGEVQQLFGGTEWKDYQDKKTGRPIVFGRESFLNFKLLAPKASVFIGEAITLRGQIAAKKIWVGKNSILSRENSFEKESDLTKIIEEEGAKFIVNEIIILFDDGATIEDLLNVANFANGRATGFIPDLGMGKIEVSTRTPEELNSLINSIRNSGIPLIDDVLPNALIL